MKAIKASVPDDVRAILRQATISGNTLALTGQLDRDVYVRVDKVLKALGGKWDRKAKAHVFSFDPSTLLGDAVESGGFVDRKKTLQFFQTPDPLAARMVELADLQPNDLALEPSAGMGRIVRHLLATGAGVDAVDIDDENCRGLRAMADLGALSVHHQSFLDYTPADRRYAAVVMNPPFRNGQDIEHIQLAFSLLQPGGRLVAVSSDGPFFRSDSASVRFRAWLDKVGATTERLPEGTFRDSGTSVNTRLIVASAALARHGATSEAVSGA